MDKPKYEVSIGLEQATYNILKDNKPVFTIRMYPDGQVHIETLYEVYNGPIDFLKFAEEPPDPVKNS